MMFKFPSKDVYYMELSFLLEDVLDSDSITMVHYDQKSNHHSRMSYVVMSYGWEMEKREKYT